MKILSAGKIKIGFLVLLMFLIVGGAYIYSNSNFNNSESNVLGDISNNLEQDLINKFEKGEVEQAGGTWEITSSTPQNTYDPNKSKQQDIPENELINNKIKRILKDQNNLNQPKIRSYNTTSLNNGNFEVFVEYNAGDHSNHQVQKNEMYKDLVKTLKEIYQHNNPYVESVKFNVYFEDKLVFQVNLGSNKAKQVNWELDEVSLYEKVMPSVWNVTVDNF
ncbi:hypothetical protein GF362_00435 [Candidatus Dojkabacteria bacterium]|nr:hypothetical protein [Candidatus Dojkabacteria bacterium]